LKNERGEEKMGLLADSEATTSVRNAPLTIAPTQWQRVIAACDELTPKMAALFQDFWGLPLRLSFLSASHRNEYFWRLDDFHVSQWGLDVAQQKMIQLRISDKVCSALLTQVLGARDLDHEQFRFSRLTDFEAQLLNRFSKELLACIVKNQVKKQPPASNKPSPLIHLIWAMKLDLNEPEQNAQPCGKILVTLPLAFLKLGPSAHSAETPKLPDSLLDHAHVEARLSIGTTKIRLDDLNHLEPGDLMVLTESHAGKMALITPETQELIPFAATMWNRSQREVPYTQDMEMMEHQQSTAMKQTLWENLMIDVTAEFMPSKLPLGQLRQMTEGLVVEVGDLVHNRVRVHVEGKTVAYGELVIVGDKFGVRIQQVEDGQNASEPIAALPIGASVPQQQPQPTPQAPAATAPQSQAQVGAIGAEEPDVSDLDQYLNQDFDNDLFQDGNGEDDEGW
jgi:flagellar motor switch protein FliN/FliY